MSLVTLSLVLKVKNRWFLGIVVIWSLSAMIWEQYLGGYLIYVILNIIFFIKIQSIICVYNFITKYVSLLSLDKVLHVPWVWSQYTTFKTNLLVCFVIKSIVHYFLICFLPHWWGKQNIFIYMYSELTAVLVWTTLHTIALHNLHNSIVTFSGKRQNFFIVSTLKRACD